MAAVASAGCGLMQGFACRRSSSSSSNPNVAILVIHRKSAFDMLLGEDHRDALCDGAGLVGGDGLRDEALHI